jgi:hypothetical protein
MSFYEESREYEVLLMVCAARSLLPAAGRRAAGLAVQIGPKTFVKNTHN